MAPCKFFAQGRCTFGASCKNSHEAVTTSPRTNTTTWSANKNPSSPDQTASATRAPNERHRSKALCWFFLQGKCTYGESCKNSHDTADDRGGAFKSVENTVGVSMKSRSDATSSSFQRVEQRVEQASGASRNTPVGTLCVFFAGGFCRNGDTCPFLHLPQQHEDTGASQGIEGAIDTATVLETKQEDRLIDNLSSISLSDPSSRQFQGAFVKFDNMGRVLEVKLASDFSAVQLSGLGTDNVLAVQTLIADLGFEVPDSAMTIKSLGEFGSVAEIRLEDPGFAKAFAKTLEHQKPNKKYDEISAKIVVAGTAAGALENRLQLSTVTCTWYAPSRTAWLKYPSYHIAKRAEDRFRSFKVRGRTIECTLQRQAFEFRRYRQGRDRGGVTTVQLGNLHRETTKKNLLDLLTGDLVPTELTFGQPSYDLSEEEASDIVETLLRSKGSLESFHCHPTSGNKIKATVAFLDRDTAAEVVRSMNEMKIDDLGNSKLFLSHVVSVKYNALTAVTTALEKEISELRENIWENGHVHLKVYPQMDPSKPFTTLRVFGDGLKNVADAKAALEKLLAGTVVMNGEATLWESYFRKPESLHYLNDLSKEYGVYIYRDAKKAQLRVYGNGKQETGAGKAQAALEEKLASLQKLSHTLSLSPDLLRRAMGGGMRLLKLKYGDAVSLNISATPKTISFTGPTEAFQEMARTLSTHTKLDEFDSENSGQPDCAVCWTEATESIVTSCGHSYCRACFADQVKSASGKDDPIQCYGVEGVCNMPFDTKELQRLLSSTAYEEFLQTSFETFIRMKPKEFHHCPTPDCPQVYRIGSKHKEVTFFCSSCLTTVCTSCNVSHEGMSCEDYKDLSSEGNKAFQKWKKENDVRACPNCKIDIEKIDGCNHMDCKQCGTHICWFCMKNFATSGECYAHMPKIHGNVYEI